MSRQHPVGQVIASERREYQLTHEELHNLLTASNPRPAKLIPGAPPPLSAQERANIAWAALGRKHGFDPLTVEPALGKGMDFFTAVPISAVPLSANSPA